MALIEFRPPEEEVERPGSVHEMSFGQLVGFLVRLFLAALPAAILASAIVAGVLWFFVVLLAGGR